MKSKLLLLTIVAALLIGSSAFAQTAPLDTIGVVDTVALVLTVDTTNLEATVELWVYSDEVLSGATCGFTWGGSPTTHFTLDSAISPAPIAAGFDLGRFYFESGNVSLSNTNQRFLFGGASLFSGGLSAQSSRRLWATYYFSISQWDGYNADGIKIDTLKFSSGSDYLFVAVLGNTNFSPWFEGSVQFGDPGLSADNPAADLPTSYTLEQNYPNPFNPTTEISFDLPRQSHVNLTIYNILGQAVTTLIDREMDAQKGITVTWDASENATGIYFYKLTAGDFTETRKMMLLK